MYTNTVHGTMLGPIIYLNVLIDVKDLFSYESTGEIITFADDTAIFYQDTSWLHLKDKIETDFPELLSFPVPRSTPLFKKKHSHADPTVRDNPIIRVHLFESRKNHSQSTQVKIENI